MSPRVVAGHAAERAARITMPKASACAIVILGATGDLARRKLQPALFALDRQGCLGEGSIVLGLGRSRMSDEAYRAFTREAIGEDEVFDREAWDDFARRLHYLDADLTDAGAYRALAGRLEELGVGDAAGGNHLFYFAVPPDLAEPIVDGLCEAGLNAQGPGWTRIVVEKPFGTDLASARDLNATIARGFAEDQVFRIDHFLGKETVQNILAFRFGNTMFEPVWNRNYVDHVQITAAEELGLEGRTGFYERTGALRDMVANHLLQLLSLTAMEPPVAYEADAVREEKVQVLRSIPPMTAEQVARRAVRGQYGRGTVDGEPLPGYLDLDGVDPDSTVETFVAVELRIENWRWAGVPFYVRTGKRLARTVTEIAVTFRRTPQALFARTDDRVAPNVIVMRFKPDEGIDVTFSAKVPGQEMRTARVRMEFDYEAAFDVDLPDAYTTLLLDALRGDPTLFTRGDEAEAQWALVTPILEGWADAGAELARYPAGSAGPEGAHRLIARHGRRWRDLDEA